MDMVRKVLNQSTDFLMSTVPFIYMFVVANLIIDRNASGAVKTERFNEFMDERYGHLPDLQDVKLFAENYFTTHTVDEFSLKWGNLLPTAMAISLYFLSTLRLGFNLSSPEKHETFVDQGMAELLNTYRLMLTASDKADGAAVSAGVQPGTEEAAMLRSEGYQPLLQKPETSDTQPIEATEPDESEPLTDAHSPNANTPPQTTTEGDFVTVNLEDIASQPDHLKSAAIARAYFNTLSGSRESKLEVVYKFFAGALIGVRAMNNVAFEGKDATPDNELSLDHK
ncbi:hypothetical protein [Endozoicomonas sp. SCSIO W0465]|uniref:hypothetical protein n=1 Tax=Endozoicomonas sp. SCSIO W0465 TaxID=2918516 RepID=UPI002075DBCA|nr:hypothetical protein [Endozoicomonas sp. SCSIO W0465]USE37722.1 hypothetical protein MJO57_05850 [Endozoicomonas sp. SCSIO W0465]